MKKLFNGQESTARPISEVIATIILLGAIISPICRADTRTLILSLSIWVEQTRLKYYSTWDESVLKEVNHGIDPGALCSNVFTELQSVGTKEEKYQMVRLDWANCMVRAIDKQLGAYPTKDWNDFLRDYAIIEDYRQKGPD